MAKTDEQFFSRLQAPAQSARMIETLCGCKWSFTVYRLISEGICRPGKMVRSVEGLSTKVLNHCLKRNVEFGVLEKISYPEIPPRVEYQFTPMGERFLEILAQLEALQEEFAQHFEEG